VIDHLTVSEDLQMARYDANVSMLFTDVPFLRRFEAAATAGFEAVEFLWPSLEQLDGLSIEQFGALIRSTGLKVPLFNFDAGDMSAGWRGLAGVPEARAQYRANLPVAIGLATELGCRKLNALAGNAQSEDTRGTQLKVLAEGLAEAAEMASPAGISVMLEALNRVDFPSYLVLDSAAALDVVARTGKPNVLYQFDLYHTVMGSEDPITVARAASGHIGHVQFADYPGRHEPGTGTLDWSAILHELDSAGYNDWIGLEYKPTDPSSRDFAFLAAIGGSLTGPTAVDA
jgi:hydroxypyruvate isomerase